VRVGTLPHNLNLDTATGAITGTPDTVGTSNFTIKVQSPGGSSDTHAYSIIVSQNADLELTASAITASPVEGGNLAYTVTVFNAGPDSATNVVLTDILPAGGTLVSNDPVVRTSSGTGRTNTWNLGNTPN